MADQIDAAIERAGKTPRISGSFNLGKSRGPVKVVNLDLPVDLTTEDLLEFSSLIGSHLGPFLAAARAKKGLVVARSALLKPS